MEILSTLVAVIALSVLGVRNAQAGCRLGPSRVLDWTKLSGMWYNTFSHENDALRLEGRCHSMVTAGVFGYDGVAVVKDVLSGSEPEDFPIKSVSEYFRTIDPGTYKVDGSSERYWIDTQALGKVMSQENVTSFVNAIAQRYTKPFAVTTNYETFIMMRQCDWNGDISVWFYTKNPNPGEREIEDINNHLSPRWKSVKLRQNTACSEVLAKIFKQASSPK